MLLLDFELPPRIGDELYNDATLRIQIDHDCRNSVIVRWKAKFEAFLRASRENSATLPDSLDALAAVAGIHTVIAPGDNLKGGVFVPWRVALYAAILAFLNGHACHANRVELARSP